MKAGRGYIPIELKAVVAALVIILAAIGTISWINLERAHEANQRSLQSLTAGYASSIAVASELPLAVRDQNELDRLLSRYLRSEQIIEFVAILDESGELVSSASRDDLEEALLTTCSTGESSDSESAHTSNDYTIGTAEVLTLSSDVSSVFDDFGFQAPAVDPESGSATDVYPSLETLGHVHVGTSNEGLRTLHARGIRSAVTTTLVAMVLCSIGVTFFVRRWSTRLQKLMDATRHIAEGDFTRELPKDQHDELGILIEAFESMRCSIQDRDASDRKQKEQLTEATRQAEEANTAKSQFLAHMSHEIRTPLNGVIGMLELLERTSLHSKQKRFVNVGRSSADALLQLINSILDFSKIEAGQLELESIDFDLGEVIETVTEMLATKGQTKGLEIACSVSPAIPERVKGDPSRLRQIVLNLLNNAIKFTEQGEVVVRATVVAETERATTVRVSVSDTGIGIPAEKRARLFKSFSQVDASTTRRFGGTGLGLAISKSLVELMGGEIGIDEERDDGSEFWFTVEFEHADNVPEPTVLASLEGARVLIVDDNQTNREILIEALTNWNARPIAVDHAYNALEMLRAATESGEKFDCIVLDMQMPDMDGLQFAETVQTDSSIDQYPILMLSSIAETADLNDLESFGITSYLPKPTRLSVLYEKLVSIIKPTSLTSKEGSSGRRGRADSRGCISGKRILIAEDNPVNQMVIQELLQQAGAKVEIANNGSIATQRWSQDSFDVILMDCEMPVMDGLTATGRIRTMEFESNRPRTPIIALTANAVQGDRERCLNAGMDDYLTKPIEPKVLFRTLESYLAKTTTNHDDVPAHEHDEPDPAPPTESLPSPDAPAESVKLTTIEIESALNRCAGNAGLLLRVFEEYTKATRRDLEELRRLVDFGDLDAARTVAHAIKGASANISAVEASRLASQIESLAKDRNHTEIQKSLKGLQSELDAVFEDLSKAPSALADQGTEDSHA